MEEVPPREDDANGALLARLAAIAERHAPAQTELTAAARRRATTLARAVAPADTSRRLVALAAVADFAVAATVGSEEPQDAVRAIVRESAAVLDVHSGELGRAVVAASARSPALAELPPREAARVQLALLVALAPIAEASLWVERAGALECSINTGAPPTRRIRAAAAAALAGAGRSETSKAFVVGVPVMRWQRPVAALVIRVRSGQREEAVALADTVTTAVGAALEKEELLDRNEERERSLVEATERRLVRLGFDLHDRPLQDLAALLAETRLLREQLVRSPSLDAHRALVIGRLDDFEARVLAVESELRELIQSLESGVLVHVPFFQLIEREVATFAGTSLEVSLDARGRADALTQSQRIALVRVIQEALANVSEHSGAARAHVSVSVTRSFLRADVTDDGRGFDVERIFSDAAKSGRLGLLGMTERIRLLGGRLDVRSRRGGPTTISATIPRWSPPAPTAPVRARRVREDTGSRSRTT